MTRGAKTASWLAGLTVASVPFGPALSVGVAGGALGVSYAQIIGVALVLHLAGMAVRGTLKSGGAHPVRLAALIVVAMYPAVIVAPDTPAAVLAYFNFATGTIVGVAVGLAWHQRGEASRAVERGAAAIAVVGTIQLELAYRASGSLQAHQAAELSWGRSNYVAGVLVAASLICLFRPRLPRLYRLAGLIGMYGAVGTYSRGALLAAIVGTTFAAVLISRRRIGPLSLAVAGVLGLVGYSIFDRVSTVRMSLNEQAARNIDSRFDLWKAASDQIFESPALGNGWVSLREYSGVVGEQQSFAHSLILSFPQMGGVLFGGFVLCVIAWVLIRAVRISGPMAAPAVALVALAFTDPVLEGFLGSMLFWMVCLPAAQGFNASVNRELEGNSQHEIGRSHPVDFR